MRLKNYTREIVVSCSPMAAYRALTSEYHKWWTVDVDSVSALGDIIKFQFGTTYWIMRVDTLSLSNVELECMEAQDGNTKIAFTHEGLVPSLDCFEVCKDGWDYFFVTSLKNYLNEGKGSPYGGQP